MRLFARSRRSFLRRALAPYERSTVAATDATTTASASVPGPVGSTTAETPALTAHDRTPHLAGGTSGSQPSTRLDDTVARFIADLEGTG